MQKTLIVLLICAILLYGVAFGESETTVPEDRTAQNVAEIDLDIYTTEELVNLRDRVIDEIMERRSEGLVNLQRGDKGDAVSSLQIRLQELGYYIGKIHGRYDAETQKAVKLFERTNGLANDGAASIEDQALLFSDEALAKPDTSQTTGSSESADVETGNPAKEQNDAHADYAPMDYSEVSRYPEDYNGDKVRIAGKVVQVLGTRTGGFQVRLATAQGSSDVVYVYINFDPGYNILENDYLTVYGTFKGLMTYTSIWNQSITIPSVTAVEIILSGGSK